MGDGVILKSKTVSALDCLHYALKMPTSVVITGIDKPEFLDQAIEAATTYEQVTSGQIAAILGRTEEAARTRTSAILFGAYNPYLRKVSLSMLHDRHKLLRSVWLFISCSLLLLGVFPAHATQP